MARGGSGALVCAAYPGGRRPGSRPGTEERPGPGNPGRKTDQEPQPVHHYPLTSCSSRAFLPVISDIAEPPKHGCTLRNPQFVAGSMPRPAGRCRETVLKMNRLLLRRTLTGAASGLRQPPTQRDFRTEPRRGIGHGEPLRRTSGPEISHAAIDEHVSRPDSQPGNADDDRIARNFRSHRGR